MLLDIVNTHKRKYKYYEINTVDKWAKTYSPLFAAVDGQHIGR